MDELKPRTNSFCRVLLFSFNVSRFSILVTIFYCDEIKCKMIMMIIIIIKKQSKCSDNNSVMIMITVMPLNMRCTFSLTLVALQVAERNITCEIYSATCLVTFEVVRKIAYLDVQN